MPTLPQSTPSIKQAWGGLLEYYPLAYAEVLGVVITYMLHVELENILSEDDAVRKARELIDRVDQTKQLVVITRQSKPAVVMIAIDQIEQLTGRAVTPVAPLASSHASAEPTLPNPVIATPAHLDTPPHQEAPATPVPTLPLMPEESGLPLMNTPPFGVTPSPTMPAAPSLAPLPSSVPMDTPEAPATPPPAEPAAPTTEPDMPTAPQPAPDLKPHLQPSTETLPPEDLTSSSPLA
jgi:prevent-host-death family protein